DRLRDQGHAAVISGAGPSVLVLSTRADADTVAALAPAKGWQVLRPGIATTGARIARVAG
ncbi:MAG: homoserine kinase, partial [Oryzihumus sp.]